MGGAYVLNFTLLTGLCFKDKLLKLKKKKTYVKITPVIGVRVSVCQVPVD